jgi:predicted ATP-grasp superfamily ATP-dependent carboligase
MKAFYARTEISCGQNIFQTHKDIVFASSKNKAREKLSAFFKLTLPDWKTVGKISLDEQG